MHARAVGKFLAGAFDHFFQFLLGALKFLLVKEAKRLIVELHLGLYARIDHFHAAALGRVCRS
jgi:hypothetical protein